MKKSGHAVSRFRCLLVGLAMSVGIGALGVSGCSLGPKQDDPADPSLKTDTGAGGPADTGMSIDVASPPLDGAASDTYDPTTGLDGCKGGVVDGGDAMAHDGEVGCDAAVDGGNDADTGDAPDGGKGEGGSDVATGD